jgi:uncharacterized protein YbjT (DUF2867 family)
MRIFVAGATGATGSVFVPRALAAGLDAIFHVRPQSALRSGMGKNTRAHVFDLGDSTELYGALFGCDAVVSFVGTDRKRFAAGDTYESSDIASTRLLIDGAKASNVPRFLLQSSIGAGGRGAYLQAKGKCEAMLRGSGLRWTVWRASGLVSSTADAPHGPRRAPPGANALLAVLRAVPGVRGFADDVRPIPIEVICDAVIRVLVEPCDGATLKGRDLWALARGGRDRSSIPVARPPAVRSM